MVNIYLYKNISLGTYAYVTGTQLLYVTPKWISIIFFYLKSVKLFAVEMANGNITQWYKHYQDAMVSICYHNK